MRRQTNEEFFRSGRPKCRSRRLARRRCRRRQNINRYKIIIKHFYTLRIYYQNEGIYMKMVLMIFRIFSPLPQVQNEIISVNRQGETLSEEIPIFDQHITELSNLPLTVWLLPLGVFAVGLNFRDAIIEQFTLFYDVMSNIYNSVQGMFIDIN